MVSAFDVSPGKLIEKTASELKKIESIKPPAWSKFAKTGTHKERPPVDPEWWYVRSAAVLRKVYVHGPIGVSKLRTKYGGKKNRGFKPEAVFKGSGSIIRKIMQQLEKADLIRKIDKGVRKGKVLTPKGKSFLDKVAKQVAKA